MREESGWPRNRWELSAPESHALLYGADGDAKQQFKLAVLELVARKSLVLEEVEESGYFGPKRTSILAAGPERGRTPESRPLAAVLRLHGGIPQHPFPGGVTGVPVADLASAAVKKYGTLTKFTQSEVMSALEARGLYRREEYRVLWVFPATRWTLTTTGQAARSDLEGTTKLGERSFGTWVESEPARAMAFLGVAGSSVLLMDGIHSDLRRLQEEGEATGYGGYAGPVGGGEGAPGTEPGEFDAGALDFGGLDFDFGALGDLGGALDSIGAGVDAGGGGGGDGGGGGGNGGGGGG